MEGPHATLGNIDVADQLFLRLAAAGTDADHLGRPGLRAAAGPQLDPAGLGDARLRSRPARPLARRRPGHGARRGLHLRAGAEPRHRSPSGQAAPPDRVGHRRGRAPGRVPLHRAVRRSSSTTPSFTSHRCRRTCWIRSRRRSWRRRRSSRRRSGAAPTAGSAACRASSWSSPPTSGSSWARRRSTGDLPHWRSIPTRGSTCCSAGEADAMENIPPPLSNVARVAADKDAPDRAGAVADRGLSALQPAGSAQTETGRIPS